VFKETVSGTRKAGPVMGLNANQKCKVNGNLWPQKGLRSWVRRNAKKMKKVKRQCIK
jgi:hypothetical protein